MRPLRTSLTISLALLATGLSTNAQGQVGNIGRDVIGATSIGDRERTVIQDAVDNRRDALLSGDWSRYRGARDALLDTLTGRGVTVAYRQTLTEILLPVAEQIPQAGPSGESWPRMAPLRIAGDLATTTSVDRVVLPALAAPEPEVRYFALTVAGKVFQSMGASPAVAAPTARRLVEAAGLQLASAEDPLIAGAAAQALEVATRVSPDLVPGVATLAMGELGNGAASRIERHAGTFAAGEFEAVVRTAGILRNIMANRAAPVGLEQAVAATRLAAHLAALSIGVARADRDTAVTLATSAELLMGFATARANQQQTLQIAQSIRDGEFNDARIAVEQLVGAGGTLTREPFELDAIDLP
ncbi:MAG: hypothetical protein AAFR38_02575 [Planctomycetota bacterium]